MMIMTTTASYHILYAPDFEIWNRTNFIKLQSLAHFQLSSDIFNNMIKYAFYKAGYIDEEPGPFQTPVQFCFDSVEGDCNHDGCDKGACAHCNHSFCYDHSVVSLHICRV